MYSESPPEISAPEKLHAELNACRARELRQAEALDALRRRSAVLESECGAARDENERLRGELRRLEQARQTHHRTATELENEIVKLHDALRDHNREANEQISRLKRQLSTAGERESRHNSWERSARVLFLFCQRQALLHSAAQLVFLVEGLAEETRVMMHSAQMRIGGKAARLLPRAGTRETPQQWREYLANRNREYGKWKHSFLERTKFGTPGALRATAVQGVATANPTLDSARLDALGAQLKREGNELVEDIRYLVAAYAALSAWAKGVRDSRSFRLGELLVCQLVKLRLRPKNAGFLQRIDSYDLVYGKWVETYKKADAPTELGLPPLPRLQFR